MTRDVIGTPNPRYIVGDSLQVLRTLPDDSVDLVVTSPPYFALRDYLAADDPNKEHEMGSEPSPAEFIDALLDVVEELARVLAPHGSLCLELGDTYAGSGGHGGDYRLGGSRYGQNLFAGSASQMRTKYARIGDGRKPIQNRHGKVQPARGGPLDKSLCLTPELLRVALVYGVNPLTGRPTPPWRIRNVVHHFRPNPPVGDLSDKWRPATSDWVVACKGTQRYFDLDGVRHPHVKDDSRSAGYTDGYEKARAEVGLSSANGWTGVNPEGAPPLDWCVEDDLEWRYGAGIILSTSQYRAAHYATFSPRLVQRLIECMCPAKVCRRCGEPSLRITEPDCGHGDWRPGLVLDPFAGSGTTLQVAHGHGRDALGIDLDQRNVDLARGRLGMFLEVIE